MKSTRAKPEIKNPVEQYYDKLAGIYDEATSKPGAWTPPAYVKEELERNRRTYGTVLIVGVGTGKDIAVLKSVGAAHIEGIDVSKRMVEQATRKFPETHLHHGDFMKFNRFKLSSYDLIICSGTLEFISDFSGFFVMCSKLLSVSGDLILTYEPIVLGHKLQYEAQTELSPELSKKWGIRGFMTYRHSFNDFLVNINKIGLRLENYFEFISYRKLETDIIYHFARLRKEQVKSEDE